MKIGVITAVLFSIIVFSSVSVLAVRINEVELNPPGADSKNEWVELYSADEISLDGWHIENVKGSAFNLSGTCSDYCVFYTSANFLTNDKQILKLFDNEGSVIDETPEISDSKNDNKSWQYCPGWTFIGSSKDEENSCEVKEDKTVDKVEDKTPEKKVQEKVQENKEIVQDAPIEKITEEKEAIVDAAIVAPEVIKLEAKGIKTWKSRSEQIKEYAVYGFALFLIVSLILLAGYKRAVRNREKNV